MTMGYFLARFHQKVVKLFSKVVGICREKGLVEFDLLAVDSVKMRANATDWGVVEARGTERAPEQPRRVEPWRGAGSGLLCGNRIG